MRKAEKALFTESELKQMKQDNRAALKRAILLGVPTSVITSLIAVKVALWIMPLLGL